MKSLEIVNDKIAELKDTYQHYTAVEKDKAKSSFAKFDIEQFQQIKQDLERLQKQDDDIKSGELSDGYHTFNNLYYQRCILFATLVNQNKKISWKSYKHENGELCFCGGWFIVGIDTPLGSYTYHYENKYWDLFQCKELECGKHWDGHTSKDVDRLLSIKNEDLEVLEIIKIKNVNLYSIKGFLNMHKKYSMSLEDALKAYNLNFPKLTMEELLKLKQWLEENEE